MAIPDFWIGQNVEIVSTEITCEVQFYVTVNYVDFEARATLAGAPYGRGIGGLLATMHAVPPNYFKAFSYNRFVIADTDLTNGDGKYRISLYAKGVDGVWSDAVPFTWNGVDANGWDNGVWV